MNETVKNIFMSRADAMLSRLENLPGNDPLLLQIAAITDPGNLRAIFSNMEFFLETGDAPISSGGYSSMPAVIFGLPAFQDFIAKEFENEISAEEIREMSAAYLRSYKKRF
jgi:hypothetical protein